MKIQWCFCFILCSFVSPPVQSWQDKVLCLADKPAPLTGETIIWEEKFPVDGDLTENGYKKTFSNNKDDFKVENGILNMSLQNSPYKGTGLSKSISIPSRCEFDFEANIAAAGSSEFDHFSLKMNLGNLLFSFKSGVWMVFRESENIWHIPGKITNGRWHKFRIRLDQKKHHAEYFIDDMDNPVFVDEKSEFSAAKSADFVIANYGLSRGTVVHCLRNIALKKLPEEPVALANAKEKRLSGTMIFRGICSEWPLDELTEKFAEEKIAVFTLQTGAHHVSNDANPFDLQPKPPVRTNDLPKIIILADMPLTPIPEYARTSILTAVEAGAKLLILNGFFTLNKGEFSGTLLEKILPVSVSDPWSFPQVLPGSETMKRDGKIFLAKRQHGKGQVIVVLELPTTPGRIQALLNCNF